MAEIIAADQAACYSSEECNIQAKAIRENVERFMLYGLPKNELEDMMLHIFESADVDQSGSLDRNVRTPVERYACRMRQQQIPRTGKTRITRTLFM